MSEDRVLPLGQDAPSEPLSDIDSAIESLKQAGNLQRAQAQKTVELEQAREIYRQETVRAAAIVTGKVHAASDGTINVPDTAGDRNSAYAVQSVTGAIGVLLNLLWISYFGVDMPMEIYGAVIVLIQASAQAIATLINNRKRS